MTTRTTENASIVIRPLSAGETDRRALADLAQRDSRRPLAGPVLGAEVDGRLLAAISLAGGDLIADPFKPTSELRAMLKLRAAQLAQGGRPRRRSRGIFGRPARPAVGGSPAGEIIALQR